MIDCVFWYGYVLWMEDGHILRRALEFEVEGQWKKGDQRGHGKSRLRKKYKGWFEHGRFVLLIKVDCWH